MSDTENTPTQTKVVQTETGATATVFAKTNHKDELIAARESFTGRTLTDGQYKEAHAISQIINREIYKSGSFIEKLTDYSHAYARSERFDAARAETIIRDVYSTTFGQTMNQTREGLLAQEDAVKQLPETQAKALAAAEAIEGFIKEGQTRPFYKAYDQASLQLANDQQITQRAAKDLMKEAYRTAYNMGLYDQGKTVEEAYHKPVREAEIAARKAEKLETQAQSRSRSRD